MQCTVWRRCDPSKHLKASDGAVECIPVAGRSPIGPFRRLCEQKLIPLSPPSFAPGWTRAEAIAEKRGSSV